LAPGALAEGAMALAEYRASRGWESEVVLLEDIYDEFSHGRPDPHAVRSFIRCARENWSRPPDCIVIAGKGTYDYRNCLNKGDNLFPVIMVPTPFGLFASDVAFADLDGSGLAAVPIGRLPAATSAQLNTLVGKIIRYEQAAGGEWTSRVLLLADNEDGAGDFEAASDRLCALLADSGMTGESLYLSRHGTAVTRSRLYDRLNSGAGFWHYFGHSSYNRMAEEGLVTPGDVGLCRNGERLSVLTAMTCLLNRYSMPGYQSLSASMLLSADGGIIGSIAPTGYSYHDSAQRLSRDLYIAVFHEGQRFLGSAMHYAQKRFAARGDRTWLLQTYTLLGDPALELKRPAATSYDDWRGDWFSASPGQDEDPGNDLADPDGDGLVNRVEYALGTSPVQPDARRGLRVLSAAGESGAGEMTVAFVRRRDAADVRYVFEASADLAAWCDVTAAASLTENIPQDDGLTERVTYRVRHAVLGGNRGFIRLVIAKR
jgi:hypothetical protein